MLTPVAIHMKFSGVSRPAKLTVGSLLDFTRVYSWRLGDDPNSCWQEVDSWSGIMGGTPS